MSYVNPVSIAVVTEQEFLQMLTFLECVVFSLSWYMLIQLFPSIPVIVLRMSVNRLNTHSTAPSLQLQMR